MTKEWHFRLLRKIADQWWHFAIRSDLRLIRWTPLGSKAKLVPFIFMDARSFLSRSGIHSLDLWASRLTFCAWILEDSSHHFSCSSPSQSQCFRQASESVFMLCRTTFVNYQLAVKQLCPFILAGAIVQAIPIIFELIERSRMSRQSYQSRQGTDGRTWFRVSFEYIRLVRAQSISDRVGSVSKRKPHDTKPPQFSNWEKHINIKNLRYEWLLSTIFLWLLYQIQFHNHILHFNLLDIEFWLHSTEQQFSPLSVLKMSILNGSSSLTLFQLWCWRAVLDTADSSAVPSYESCGFFGLRQDLDVLYLTFKVFTVFSSKEQELLRLDAVELQFWRRRLGTIWTAFAPAILWNGAVEEKSVIVARHFSISYTDS
jgi:hypothetical protein